MLPVGKAHSCCTLPASSVPMAPHMAILGVGGCLVRSSRLHVLRYAGCRHTHTRFDPPPSAGSISAIAKLQQQAGSSEDLKTKCGRALSAILPQLTHMPSLEQLVQQ